MTTSLSHRMRLFARRIAGVDVRRYPESDPLFAAAKLLKTAGTTLLLDVGANDGGYAMTMRRLGYSGKIVSFEPVEAPYRSLCGLSSRDNRWEALQLALADRCGVATVNVAGNAGASSSLLPMLDRHKTSAPASQYVGTQMTPIKRLDAIWADLGAMGECVFLKLDVQGAEGLVLDGASGVMREVVGVQTELSLVDLYEGQPTFHAMVERLEDDGLILAGLIPGFADQRTGQLLQADGVFVRPSHLV